MYIKQSLNEQWIQSLTVFKSKLENDTAFVIWSKNNAIECDKLHFMLYLPATTDTLQLILKNKPYKQQTSAWSLYILYNNY